MQRGATVALTAEAPMDECPDARVAGKPAPTHEAVPVGVWSQGGAESTVASVHTNDGSSMPVRFAVPADAARGAATVTVAHATLELEVSDEAEPRGLRRPRWAQTSSGRRIASAPPSMKSTWPVT